MNTSIHGMKRTAWCGELRAADAGSEVVLNGWCDRTRDNGGVLFLLLRDRTGIVQCTFDKSVNSDLFDIAFGVRMEYVLAVRGTVTKRDERAINPKMPTGEVEITVTDVRILSKSETTPFEISDDKEVNDQLRLKYRYLDLRRPSMQRNLQLRHRITKIARDYFDEQGFWRSRRRFCRSPRRRARVTIWFRPVCIRARSTPCRSPRSSISSC